MRKALTGREKARAWRAAHKYSLLSVAVEIGYKSHAPYERWESGNGSLPIDRLLLLEELTGIDAEELAGEKQAETIRRLREKP